MPSFRAPLDDIRFVLHEVLGLERLTAYPGYEEATPDLIDAILAEAGRGMDAVVFGHAGDGNVHVNPLVPVDAPGWEARVRAVLEGVVELVASLGGTLAGEHGDGRLRAPFLDRIWGPELSRLFRAMKGAMDPEGILNPGVVVPLPGQDPLEALHPRPRDWPT